MIPESMWPGDVPGRSGKGQYGKGEKNKGVTMTPSPAMPYPMNKGQGKTLWTTDNEPQ